MKLPQIKNPLILAVIAAVKFVALGIRAILLSLFIAAIVAAGIGMVLIVAFILAQGSQRAAIQIGEPASFVSISDIRTDCRVILICGEFGERVKECSVGANIEKCVSLHMAIEDYQIGSVSCSDRGQVTAPSVLRRWSKPPTATECTLFNVGYFGLIGSGRSFEGSQSKRELAPADRQELKNTYPESADGSVVVGRRGEVIMKIKGEWRLAE